MSNTTESVSLPEFSRPDFRPRNKRRVLCVFPEYAKSFGTFQHAFPLMPPVRAFMPPQGILLIVALLPKEWEVHFVDENIRKVTSTEMEWADVVFLSGMHIQRPKILDLICRANKAGKITVLGGPSVSAVPETYPEPDYLHCGEVGDATWLLFEHLDKSVAKPAQQKCFRTTQRLPLTEFPSPAYDRINVKQYLLGSVQWSSGCPFTCEFCDIPGLYGRSPRTKTNEQILLELDDLADRGAPSIYFVDDNFIGNPKAAMELLPMLVEWQKKRDYQVRLSCELTLNISRYPEVLKLMREAFFTNVFCGIETPEPNALKAMKKSQNLRTPILESVDIISSYGIEVASGIIMGLDTDTDETPRAILDFVEASGIPILTVNILYALPHTPLYSRLQTAGRLVSDEGRESNIEFLRPYDRLVNDWQGVISAIYDPENLYRRYEAQAAKTYHLRMKPVNPLSQLSWYNLQRFVRILIQMFWRVGIRADYRKHFWKMFWRQLKQGNIETILQVAMVAHHLIMYSRDCTQGSVQASNYSTKQVPEDKALAA